MSDDLTFEDAVQHREDLRELDDLAHSIAGRLLDRPADPALKKLVARYRELRDKIASFRARDQRTP